MRRGGPRLAAALVVAALAASGCSADDASGTGGDDTSPGEVVAVPGVVGNAGSVAFVPATRRLVAPCDGDLCQWTLSGRYAGRVDGGAIAASSDAGIYTDRVGDGTVELVLLDAESGEQVAAVDAYPADEVRDGPGQGLRTIVLSPDATWVAGVGADGVVRRWAAGGLSDELTIDSGGDAVAAAFSPDASTVAIAHSDAPVTLHDVTTGEQVGELDSPPQGAVVWSEEGWLATASFALDDTAATTIWDAGTREARASLDVAANRLALADPGALLLTQKDDEDVLRWGWREDDLTRYRGATDVPKAVLYVRDDARVVAVSPRDGVLAWDARSGRLTTFERPAE